MEIKHPIISGILIGNQLASIMFLIYNLITNSFIIAFSVYGFSSLIIIYPTLIIGFIINSLNKRRER